MRRTARSEAARPSATIIARTRLRDGWRSTTEHPPCRPSSESHSGTGRPTRAYNLPSSMSSSLLLAGVSLLTSPWSMSSPLLTPKHARARANGVAARERERQKHRRYPGPGLVAAAIETGGRCGRELSAFLKEHAPRDPALRPLALQDVRQGLATALARGNAQMLLGSAGALPRPWPTHGQLSAASRRSP